MNEYEKRKAAVTLYQSGEKITKIVKSLGKTRQWFYNWLHRYEQRKDETTWFIDESKAPKHNPSKLDHFIEQKILDIRRELDNQHFAQTGAIAIQYAFHNCKLKPPPVWTINRVLAKNGLNKSEPKVQQSHDYPELFVLTHQMDLVGPRYIKGDGHFYSLNIIDMVTHTSYAKPIRVKSSEEIVKALAEFWNIFGLPDALQMDNELAFRGSNRYPRSFGKVVRFALQVGVVPVFIPIKEPWRNGMIEKFNNTYEKRFLTSKIFLNFQDLEEETKRFISFHNANHRYSSQNHKTPNEAFLQSGYQLKYTEKIHELQRIPMEEGIIYFIRFIRSDLMLRLPTEQFKVDNSLKYCYVVAEVNLETQSLIVRKNEEIKHIFPYLTSLD